ncbi:MAG: CoA transferase, partial [Mycolicibacterium sp.]|nr:CoA transferase [Mycolicibacterium sp.]
KAPPNPLINGYAASDGQWFWLLGLQGDRHWPDVVRAVDRPDLLEDPRYATLRDRLFNSASLVAELDAIFATRTRHEWCEIFDRENVWWAPLQPSHEAIEDPQAEASGAFVDVPSDAGPVRMVASPVDFRSTPTEQRSMPPEAGQHTEEILLELGMGWDEIVAAKEAGAIL